MIKHNVYFNGAVQSLGAENVKGTDFTVGVVEPGEYDFGTATRTEEIRVILGCLKINGVLVFGSTRRIIPTGRRIRIKADDTAAYVCCYR